MSEGKAHSQKHKHEQRKNKANKNQNKSQPHVSQKNIEKDRNIITEPNNALKIVVQDEVLNNSDNGKKYAKKEIESNWSKYEAQVESYDEFEAQEQNGVNFEDLIKAPLSSGGHFQFKHEKTWDNTTLSTEFDKYFDVDYEDLCLALNTIPFHKRNDCANSMFNNNVIANMEHRANKYKFRYYKDEALSTVEMIHATKLQGISSSGLKELSLPVTDIKNTIITDKELVIQSSSKKEAPVNEEVLQNQKENSRNDILDYLKSEGDSAKNEKEAPKLNLEQSPEDLEKWLDDFLDS